MSKQQENPNKASADKKSKESLGFNPNKVSQGNLLGSKDAFATDSKYNKNWSTQFGSLQEHKYKEQGVGEALANEAVNTIGGAILGVGEQVGYLVDLPNAFRANLDETKDNFDNSFSEYFRKKKEDLDEALPVYQDPNAKTKLNFGDGKFWIQAGGDIIESIAEFAITGAGAGSLIKGTAMATLKGLKGAKLINTADKLVKAQNIANKVSQGGTSIALGHTIGGLQAVQTYDQIYQAAVNKGYDVEQAKKIAGDAAASTYSNTVLYSSALNMTTLAPFFKSTRLPKVNRESTDNVKKLLAKYKNLKSNPESLNKAGFISSKLMGVGFEGAQEAVEEVSELYAQRLGLQKGFAELGEEFEIDMTDEETILSATLGAIGGTGMKGAMELVSSITDQGKGQKALYEQSLEDKIKSLETHVELTDKINDVSSKYKEATDPEQRKKLNQELIELRTGLQINSITSAFNDGTEDVIAKEIEVINNLTDEEASNREDLETNQESPNFFKKIAKQTNESLKRLKNKKANLDFSELPIELQRKAMEMEVAKEVNRVNQSNYRDQLDTYYEDLDSSVEGINFGDRIKVNNKLKAIQNLRANTTDASKLSYLKSQEIKYERQLKELQDVSEELDIDLQELNQSLVDDGAVSVEEKLVNSEYNFNKSNEIYNKIFDTKTRNQVIDDIRKEEKIQEEKTTEEYTKARTLDIVQSAIREPAVAPENPFDYKKHRTLYNRYKIEQAYTEKINQLEESKKALNNISTKYMTDLQKQQLKEKKQQLKEEIDQSLDKYKKALRDRNGELLKRVNTEKSKRARKEEIKNKLKDATEDEKEAVSEFAVEEEYEEDERTNNEEFVQSTEGTTSEEVAEQLAELDKEKQDILDRPDSENLIEGKTPIETAADLDNSTNDIDNYNEQQPEEQPAKTYPDNLPVPKDEETGQEKENDAASYGTVPTFYFDGANQDGIRRNADGTPAKFVYKDSEGNSYNPEEVFATDGNGVLLANSPNLKVGQSIEIIYEPFWKFGGKYKGDSNWQTAIINIYKSEDLEEGRPIQGAKPIAQLPKYNTKWNQANPLSVMMNDNADTIREKLAKRRVGNLKTTITGKTEGTILNLRNEKNQKVENDISTLKNTWIEDGDKWVLGQSERSPIMTIGIRGTQIVPNVNQLNEQEKQDLVKAGFSYNEDGELIRFTGNDVDGRVYAMLRDGSGKLSPVLLNKTKVDNVETIFNSLPNIDINNPVFKNIGKYIKNLGAELPLEGNKLKIEAIPENAISYTKNSVLIEHDNYIYAIKRTDFPKIQRETIAKIKVFDRKTGEPYTNAEQGITNGLLELEGERITKFKQTLEEELSNLNKQVDISHVNKQKFTKDSAGNDKSYFDYLSENRIVTTNTSPNTHFVNHRITFGQEGNEENRVEENRETREDLTVAEAPTEASTSSITSSEQEELNNLMKKGYGKLTEDEKRKVNRLRAKLMYNADSLGDDYVMKPYKEGGFKVLPQSEIAWFKRIIGEDYLNVVKNVDKVLANGQRAFGYYKNAMVTVAEHASEGTAFHEAFHFVFRATLDERQQNELLTEAKKLYGNQSTLELEERLAEAFEEYQLTGNLPVKKAKSFFDYIISFIKNLLGKTSSINKMFENISNGNINDIKLDRTINTINNGFAYKLVPGLNMKMEKMAIDSINYLLINRIGKENLDETATNPELLNKRYEQVRKDLEGTRDSLEASLAFSESILQGTKIGDSDALDYLFKNPKDFFTNPILDNLQEEARNFKKASSLLDLYERILDNWEDSKFSIGGEEGLNTEDGIKTKAIKAMRGFGFQVSINGETLNPIDIEENTEHAETTDRDQRNEEGEGDKRIHDISFALRPVKTTMSSTLRRELSTIAEPKIVNGEVQLKEDGTVQYQTNPLNQRNFVDFDEIYSKLASGLADTDIDKIYDRLTQLAAFDPKMAVVKNWLDRKAYDNDGIYAKFMSFFDKQQLKFIVLDGTTTQLKYYESNRQSVDNLLKERWRKEAFNKKLISYNEQDETVINKEKVKAIKEVVAKGKRSKDFIKAAKKAHKMLGIELDNSIYQDYENKGIASSLLASSVRSRNDISVEGILNADGDFTMSQPFSNLAVRAKDYVNDMYSGSFMNGDNKQVYSINLNTPYSEMVRDLKKVDKNGKPLFYNTYYRDRFYYNGIDNKTKNLLLKTLEDRKHRENFELFVLDSIKHPDTGNKTFENASDLDSIFGRMVAFFAQDNNVLINTGTKSDKKQSYFAKVPKIERVLEETNPTEALVKALKLTAYQEMRRMKKESNGIATYSKNKNKFNYLPFLNDILIKDGQLKYGMDNANNTELEARVDEAIRDYSERLLSREKIKLQEEGLLDVNNNPKYPSLRNKNVDSFLVNDLIWKMEMSKVFMSDLAYYKSSDDYYKRAYQVITPGTKPFIHETLGTPRQSYKQGFYSKVFKINDNSYLASIAQLINKDVTEADIDKYLKNSEVSEAKEEAVKIASAYKEANKTDAASFSTLKFYRDVKKGYGDWTKEHESAYQKAWKGNLTKEESKILLQPLKPFRYGFREGKDGSYNPIQIKDSIFPILPQLADNHKGFKELLNNMENGNLDVVSAEDAVKIGLPFKEKFNKVSKGIEMKFKDFRMPLEIPSSKETNLYGTQLGKIILSNIENDNNYTLPDGNNLNGKELKDLFHEGWGERFKRSFNELREELGLEEDMMIPENRLEFLKKLRNILQEQNDSRDLPDNYTDALNIVERGLTTFDYSMPLSFPAFSKKFENIIMSLFKNRIIKQKFNGYSMVNLADFATGTEYDDELQFIRSEDGKVVEAEIGIPYDIANKIGLGNLADGRKLDWSKLNDFQRKALQVIAYRIPTQGKNSMLPARVARILPKGMGSSIMMPGEGTVQGGFDFDIDKSFMMFRHVEDGKVTGYQDIFTEDSAINKNNINNLSKEQLDNMLFDVHWSILTSPNHIREVLQPLDSANLKNFVTEFGDVNKEDDFIFSLSKDIQQEKLNKYAKALVGISSLHNTSHSTMQQIGDDLYTLLDGSSIVEGKNKNNSLSKIKDNEGAYITDNIIEWQNAFLDNAKEPISGYLNANTFTGNVLFTLLRLGYSNRAATLFINQPVIKKFSNAYYRNNEDYNKALKEIMNDGFKSSLGEIQLGGLETEVKNGTQEFQSKVLGEFEKLYKMGKDISRLNKVLSPDTIGNMSTISQIDDWINTINGLIENSNYIQISSDIFNMETSPIKRIAGAYEYGIKAAETLGKQLFPYNRNGFKAVKSDIANKLIKDFNKLSVSEINTVNNALQYYLFNDPSIKEKIFGKDMSKWEELMFGKNNLTERLERLKKEYPRLKGDPLFKSLNANPYNATNTTKQIQFNNTYKRNKQEKNSITNAWHSYLKSTNPEIRQFAEDLIGYSLLSSGFDVTTNSFIELSPVSYWEEKGINEDFNKVLNQLDGELYTDAATDNIIRQYKDKLVPKMNISYVQGQANKELTEHLTNIKSDKTGITSFSIHISSAEAKYINTSFGNKFSEYVTIPHKKQKFYQGRPVGIDKSLTDNRLFKVRDLVRAPNGIVVQANYEQVQSLGKEREFYELPQEEGAKSMYPPNEGIQYFQLNEEAPISYDLSMDTENILKGYLANLGVNVQVVENLKEKYGVDANAVANITENIVEVVKGKKGRNALPEEAASFFIESVAGTPLYNDMMKEVINTQEYDTVLREYKGLYNTTEDYKKEAASKIIAKHIINGDKAKGKLGTLIERLWNKIKSFFLKANSFKEASRQITNQKVTNYVKGQGIFYQLNNEEEQSKEIKDIKSLIKKLTDGLKTKAKAYKDNPAFKNKLKKLISQIEDMEGVEAMITFVDKAKKDVGILEDRLEKEVNEGTITGTFIRKIDDYTGSYEALNDLLDYIDEGKEIPLDENYEDFRDVLRKEVQEAINSINTLNRNVDRSNIKYLANKLYTLNTDKSLSRKDIEDQLTLASKDISAKNFRVDPTADSSDPIVSLATKLVYEAKQAAKNEGIELLRKEEGFEKVNRQYENWLKEQGVDINNTWERNKFILNGKDEKSQQGYFLHEWSDEWYTAKAKFEKTLASMNKAIEEGESTEAKAEARKARNNYLRNWQKENTTLNPKMREIVEQKEKELSSENFDIWVDENFQQSTTGKNPHIVINGISYYAKLGEMRIPVNKYRNEKYDNLQKQIVENPNSPLAKYYNLVVQEYVDKQENLPLGLRRGYKIPAVRKTLMERFTDSNGIKKLSVIKEGFIDSFKRTYDETDRIQTDEHGNEIKSLPVRFISGNISASELSLDVATTSLLAQSSMIDYDKMAKVIDDVELIEGKLKERKVTKTRRKDWQGILDGASYTQVKDANGNVITKEGIESNSYKHFNAFKERIVYGKTKKDEGSLNILGQDIDVAKTVDSLLRYTGINSLVGNVFQAVSNATTGEVQILQEAIGGRFYELKDWAKAKKILMKETPKMLGDVGRRDKASKIMLAMEKLNILDESIATLAPELGKDTTRVKSLMSTDTLFIIQKYPEFQMQATSVLAMMNKVKAEDGTTLWDAMYVDNGEVKIDDKYKNEFTEEKIERLRRNSLKVNQKIHGIYNQFDDPSINAYTWGRAITFFRGWLVPGFNRRWQRGFYNQAIEEYDEGSYISLLKFAGQLKQDLSKFKMRYLVGNIDPETDEFVNLTPEQIANVKKALVDLYTFASLFLAGIAWGLTDDDEEMSPAMAFMRYQFERVGTELGAYTNPLEAWKILKSPSAAMTTIKDLMEASYYLLSPEGWQELERGKYQGQFKVKKEWIDLIPFRNSLDKFDNIEQQINYIKGIRF